MDLKLIHDTIDFFTDKAGSGMVSHAEKDIAIDRGQMSLFNDYYNNPKAFIAGRQVPAIGYGETQRINDALSPFKETYPFTNINTPSGILTLPDGYMYLISLYTTQFVTALNRNVVRPVQVLNEEELISRLESQVVPVTGSNPICILNKANKIQLYPEVGQSGKVFYFRRPVAPNYVYTVSGRAETYDSVTSTQLEWNEQEITNIINRALSILGLNLSSQEVSQYAAFKEQKGE